MYWGVLYNGVCMTDAQTPVSHKSPFHVLYRGLLAFLGVLSLLWVMLSVVVSQQLAPQYFAHVENEQRVMVTYLNALRKDSLFLLELQRAVDTYGVWVRDDVYKADSMRINSIQELEQKLQIYPSNRDIYISLSRLYEQAGDEQKSMQTLQKAQEIDPLIGR